MVTIDAIPSHRSLWYLFMGGFEPIDGDSADSSEVLHLYQQCLNYTLDRPYNLLRLRRS